MKTFILMLSMLILSGSGMTHVTAAPLDGVWRSADKRITVKIESTREGIRSLWSGQDDWDHYTKSGGNRYVDSQGNYFEATDVNEMLWRENRTKRIVSFLRMYDTPVPPEVANRDRDTDRIPQPGSPRDRNDDDGTTRDRERDDDDVQYKYDRESRFAGLTGAWFNQKTRQHMWVQSVSNGLRISTGKAKPTLYVPSRDSKVFRSRNGETLVWLNNHTLQLKGNGQNLIFHRDDDQRQATKGKGKHKDHPRGHAYGHAKKGK